MLDIKKQHILIDFNMLFDTDLGCIRYLLYTYPNSKFFLNHIKNSTDYFITYSLLTRRDINPLSVLLKPEYIENKDSLYQELVKNKWEDVLKFSEKTDILRLIYSTYKSSGYYITINCLNTLEQFKIEELISEWSTVIDCTNASKYFCLFIHDILDFTKYSNLDGKCIYIYDHASNFLDYEQRVLSPLALLKSRSNELKIISPYSDFELPISEKEILKQQEEE